MGTLLAVCISSRKGIRKQPVAQATLQGEFGVAGDAHAGKWHRQVSLLAWESIEKMRAKGLRVNAGSFAENLTTSGIDLPSLPIGSRLRVGSEALLEITQIGKECHARCAIYSFAGDCVMPREGIFARVLSGGLIKPGDPVALIWTDRFRLCKKASCWASRPGYPISRR
ncbi:MAG: MOSC domain-containing protein [Elusimicrobia bacterium]|nr:MOSC domain-containing protein [Elusimicrobiota bacterium]